MEKNGRLFVESGPEREVCAMTMKCPEWREGVLLMEERCVRTARLCSFTKEEGKAGEEELITEGVDVEILTTVNDHLEAELLQGILGESWDSIVFPG